MAIFDENFKEIFASQIVSIIGGLIAGFAIAFYLDKLFLIPGFLIILPGFLEMRGNISGSLASRLSSGLFLGVVKTDKWNTHLLRGNIIAAFALAVVVSLVLGLLAFIFNYLVFDVVLIRIVFIPLIAGIIASALEIPLTLYVTFTLFKNGHDPNNIIGPFLTSTGDIISILALLVAVVVV